MPFNALKPDAAAYGIFPQAYAAKLAASTGNPAADAINQIALMLQSGSGSGDYTSALQAANEAQIRGAGAENQADVAKAYFPTAAPNANAGIAHSVLPNEDNPYLRVDPNQLAQADALHQQNTLAETIQRIGTGLNQASEGGYGIPAAAVGPMITAPQATAPVVSQDTVNPGDKAAQTSAAASAKQADAAIYRAVHNQEGKQGGETTDVYIPDGKGGQVLMQHTEKTKHGRQQSGNNGVDAPAVTPGKLRFTLGPDGKVHPVASK